MVDDDDISQWLFKTEVGVQLCLFVIQDVLADEDDTTIVKLIEFDDLLFTVVVLEGVTVLLAFKFFDVCLLLVYELVEFVTIKFSIILNAEPISVGNEMVFDIAFEIFCFPIEKLLLKAIRHVISINVMKTTRNIIHAT